jgi:hypothetical protein
LTNFHKPKTNTLWTRTFPLILSTICWGSSLSWWKYLGAIDYEGNC